MIKRIGPASCARIIGTLHAIVGLVLGGIFSLIALAGGFASDRSGPAGVGAMIGAGAIILVPILYGAIGFVAALIAAWLYNAIAGLVGGG